MDASTLLILLMCCLLVMSGVGAAVYWYLNKEDEFDCTTCGDDEKCNTDETGCVFDCTTCGDDEKCNTDETGCEFDCTTCGDDEKCNTDETGCVPNIQFEISKSAPFLVNLNDEHDVHINEIRLHDATGSVIEYSGNVPNQHVGDFANLYNSQSSTIPPYDDAGVKLKSGFQKEYVVNVIPDKVGVHKITLYLDIPSEVIRKNYQNIVIKYKINNTVDSYYVLDTDSYGATALQAFDILLSEFTPYEDGHVLYSEDYVYKLHTKPMAMVEPLTELLLQPITFDSTETYDYRATSDGTKTVKSSDGTTAIVRKGRSVRIQGYATSTKEFKLQLVFKSFVNSPSDFDAANAEWVDADIVDKTYEHTYTANTTAIDTTFALTHCAYALESIKITGIDTTIEFDLTKLTFDDNILSTTKGVWLRLTSSLSGGVTYYQESGNFEVSLDTAYLQARNFRFVGTANTTGYVKSGDRISLQGDSKWRDDKSPEQSYVVAKDDGDVEINSDCDISCRWMYVYAYGDDGIRVTDGTYIKINDYVKFKFEKYGWFLGIKNEVGVDNIATYSEEKSNHHDLWKIDI